jgi:probable F420-dependent oxidoreductase
MAIGIGVQLPHSWGSATASGIIEAARASEAAGMSSLSVTERFLYPVAEVGGMPGGAAKSAPEHSTSIFDPLETLAAVASVTQRVKLISAICTILYQPPVLLARRAATIDNLSGGRFHFGVGQGWMAEEFAAAGVPLSRRGAGYEEHVAAMRALWQPDPVSFTGRFYEVPLSYFGPKPVTGNRVPIYAGFSSEPGIARSARFADGWLPVTGAGSTIEGLLETLDRLHRATDAIGRDPLNSLHRAHTAITERPVDKERRALGGSVEQVAEDLRRLEPLGVVDVCLNQTQQGVPFDEQLDAARQVKALLDS